MLKIAGLTYKIEQINDLKSIQGVELWGQHSSKDQTIRLDTSIPSDHKRLEVLFHEAFHGLYNHYELADDDKEERIVACLSSGLLMLLRDNPKLLKYIREVLE
jgi:hypothetical protein